MTFIPNELADDVFFLDKVRVRTCHRQDVISHPYMEKIKMEDSMNITANCCSTSGNRFSEYFIGFRVRLVSN